MPKNRSTNAQVKVQFLVEFKYLEMKTFSSVRAFIVQPSFRRRRLDACQRILSALPYSVKILIGDVHVSWRILVGKYYNIWNFYLLIVSIFFFSNLVFKVMIFFFCLFVKYVCTQLGWANS